MEVYDKTFNSHSLEKVISLKIRESLIDTSQYNTYGSGDGEDDDNPITIEKGKLTKRIFDWFRSKTVSFDFKISRVGRAKQYIAVLSDRREQNCCNINNAMFIVFLGVRMTVSVYLNFALCLPFNY